MCSKSMNELIGKYIGGYEGNGFYDKEKRYSHDGWKGLN